MRKTYLAAAASLGALLLASTPASAAITFNLDNVNFIGGGTLTGSFTTSDDLSSLLDFSLTTSANVYNPFYSFTGRTYTLADATTVLWSSNIGLTATFLSPLSQIGLLFASPLTVTGTNLVGGDETVFQFGRGLRLAIGGSVSAAPAVPEPATWAMMIGGLALVGFSMRRRKVAVSFA